MLRRRSFHVWMTDDEFRALRDWTGTHDGVSNFFRDLLFSGVALPDWDTFVNDRIAEGVDNPWVHCDE